MAGTITPGAFPKLMWPGLNTIYGDSYDSQPEFWRMMYEVVSSDQAWEEDLSIVGLGVVPMKDPSSPVDYDSMEQGWTTRYVHSTYSLGFVVSEEAREDDMYGKIANANAQSLGFSIASTLNILGAAPYVNAQNTSWTYGDNTALLSGTQPHVSGGSFSNLSSDTFGESALEAACIAIEKWTDDRGLRIAVQTEKLILPPDLGFEAERVLNSPLRSGTSDNDLLALRKQGRFPGGFMTNPFLTQATSWFIKTNVPRGMRCFLRRAPRFESDNDFDTSNMKFKGSFRVSFGDTDKRGIYGYDTA